MSGVASSQRAEMPDRSTRDPTGAPSRSRAPAAIRKTLALVIGIRPDVGRVVIESLLHREPNTRSVRIGPKRANRSRRFRSLQIGPRRQQRNCATSGPNSRASASRCDECVLEHSTFGDLAVAPEPRIHINATALTASNRIPLGQPTFTAICPKPDPRGPWMLRRRPGCVADRLRADAHLQPQCAIGESVERPIRYPDCKDDFHRWVP